MATQPTTPAHPRRNLTAGIILIAIGLFALAGQFMDAAGAGRLVLPALGVIFILWGIGTRNAGLLVPGGILGGIGLGALLVEGPGRSLGSPAEGGLFFLAFALGWGSITLFSGLFTGRTIWWPLVPGGILAAFGVVLLSGNTGQRLLLLLGTIWPALLIALGLYLIGRQFIGRK